MLSNMRGMAVPLTFVPSSHQTASCRWNIQYCPAVDIPEYVDPQLPMFPEKNIHRKNRVTRYSNRCWMGVNSHPYRSRAITRPESCAIRRLQRPLRKKFAVRSSTTSSAITTRRTWRMVCDVAPLESNSNHCKLMKPAIAVSSRNPNFAPRSLLTPTQCYSANNCRHPR